MQIVIEIKKKGKKCNLQDLNLQGPTCNLQVQPATCDLQFTPSVPCLVKLRSKVMLRLDFSVILGGSSVWIFGGVFSKTKTPVKQLLK